MPHTGSLLLSLLFILPLCCFICVLCSTGNDWFCDLIRVGIICHWFCTKRGAPWGSQIFIAAQLEAVCNYWVRVWDWSCQLWVCFSCDHREIAAENCWSEHWGSSLLWFVNAGWSLQLVKASLCNHGIKILGFICFLWKWGLGTFVQCWSRMKSN